MHICESDGLYFDQLKSCTSLNGFTNKDKDMDKDATDDGRTSREPRSQTVMTYAGAVPQHL